MASNLGSWLGNAENASKVQAGSNILNNGIALGRQLLERKMYGDMVRPAVRKYLDTLESNAGYSGYSKAQTDSLQRARDMARGEVAKALGDTMASNMSLGQRMSYMTQSGANANNIIDTYDLHNSLLGSQNNMAANEVAIRQGRKEGIQDSINDMFSLVGNSAKPILSALSAKGGKDNASVATMEPSSGTSSNNGAPSNTAPATAPADADVNAAIERIRQGTASDDDLRLAYKHGYKGGGKTQAAYRSLGLQ